MFRSFVNLGFVSILQDRKNKSIQSTPISTPNVRPCIETNLGRKKFLPMSVTVLRKNCDNMTLQSNAGTLTTQANAVTSVTLTPGVYWCYLLTFDARIDMLRYQFIY